MKKALSMLLALMLCVSLTVPALAAERSDVTLTAEGSTITITDIVKQAKVTLEGYEYDAYVVSESSVISGVAPSGYEWVWRQVFCREYEIYDGGPFWNYDLYGTTPPEIGAVLRKVTGGYDFIFYNESEGIDDPNSGFSMWGSTTSDAVTWMVYLMSDDPDGNDFEDSAYARTTSDTLPLEMDTAAVIVNDRTYAPIRYLAEYFGYTVGWNGASKTVTIQ